MLVYLDDIVCFSEEFEDHLETLEWVLNKLLKSKLKLKAPKCKFAYNKVKYLGHIVSEAGVSPDPNKLHAILDYAPPKNAKQVKQILGSFNFYRNFSKYSKFLTDLTRKNVPFIWTDECQRNFQILKEKLMTAPATAFSRFTTENGGLPKLNVYSDASKKALAAILTQVQDNNERLISYIGRNILPADMRYSTHEKEALTIFYAFKKFDSYLRYAHTTVYTDCSSLSSILKRPGNAVSPRIARCVYALTAYEYDIVYRKGAINHGDSFSRNKYSQELTQEDVELNTYPFMNAIHSQASTHLDTNSLHIAAGSRCGLHVAKNGMPTLAVRDESLTSDKPHTDRSHSAVSASNRIATDNYRGTAIAKPSRSISAKEQMNKIIVNTASDEATSAHQYAPSPADDNFPYGSKLTTEMVATEQKLDRKLAPLIKYIDEDTLPEDDKLARKIIFQSANYNYTDGLLYHQQASCARNVNQLNIQLVIPDNLRAIVLEEYHDNLGHRGKINTFYNIRTNYYWENMFKDIHDYIQSCMTFMKHKHTQKKDRAPLTLAQPPPPPPQRPFSTFLFRHFGTI